jgi:hypothetical protein
MLKRIGNSDSKNKKFDWLIPKDYQWRLRLKLKIIIELFKNTLWIIWREISPFCFSEVSDFGNKI